MSRIRDLPLNIVKSFHGEILCAVQCGVDLGKAYVQQTLKGRAVCTLFSAVQCSAVQCSDRDPELQGL